MLNYNAVNGLPKSKENKMESQSQMENMISAHETIRNSGLIGWMPDLLLYPLGFVILALLIAGAFSGFADLLRYIIHGK